MINNLTFLNFIKKIIFFGSIFYFLYFLSENKAIFDQLFNLSFYEIFAILIAKLSNIIFLSYTNLFILKNLQIKMSLAESINITVNNIIGNLVTPFKLGSGYKISYLKQHYNFKIKDYIYWNSYFSIIVLLPILALFVVLIFNFEFFQLNMNAGFFILILLLIGIFYYLITKIFVYFTNYDLNSLFIFNKDNLKIQINYFLFFLGSTLITFLIARNLIYNFNYLSSFSYNFLNSFVNLINLTPGNIGIKEGFIIFFNKLHNIQFEFVIVISFIERLATFIVSFIFQFIFKLKSK
tara:strand:- start:1621 stop:2502 length:882 start_codon:yes stop_codon:yes gene_type:complete